MATASVCDACGSVIVGDTKKRGLFVVVEYCEDCAGYCDDYLKELQAFHTDLARQWANGHGKLKDKYRTRYPGMKFPDE